PRKASQCLYSFAANECSAETAPRMPALPQQYWPLNIAGTLPERYILARVDRSPEGNGFPLENEAGSVTVKTEPASGLLVAVTWPPCASTTAFTRLRPSPRPRCERLR